ncbi:MAG: phosphate ABC transporter substrate-binding protein PstS [Thiobacillaceae bacterium]
MKLGLLIATVGLAVTACSQNPELTGAGSTFAYPVLAKWADAYRKEAGTGLNYQSIGSGGGIKQIEIKTVDFGATDAPLSPEQLTESNLVQFPVIMGGVVPVINLPGLKPAQVKLSASLLADLFMGRIRKWNDPRIVSLNPDIQLPEQAVSVVHRADGSGTTFIFTNYLSKASPEWKASVGEGTAVKWPAGSGGKGNEGVAAYVQRIKGSIGYVEYAYALQNKMSFTQLQNRDGQFVSPGRDSFTSAAANANWDKNKGFYEILTDEPGKDSWPITGATFILMQKQAKDAGRNNAVLKFINWAYKNGGAAALELDYIPMPENVVKLIQASWEEQLQIKM